RRSGAEPAAYRRAQQQAEISCRLLPFEGSHQTTLGMAQYRLGQYQEALATLTHADELNQALHGRSVPADLALLAMTRYRLGENDRARETWARLREAVAKETRATKEEAESLLKEAEALLVDQARRPQQ